MSNFLAIATATAALQDLLTDRAVSVVPEATVTLSRPD